MFEWIWSVGSKVKGRLEAVRLERRWSQLRKWGMHIGKGVYLPASTWIDTYCFLISIGDWCGFGEGCTILTHDFQMREFLGAGRIGRVIIHESSHIGAHTIILPGVEIGPRTIVGAGSVVSTSLPPDTVCAGIPAKEICSLEAYLAKHRTKLATRPKFEGVPYDISGLTPERRAELIAAVADGDAYVTIGRRAERIYSRRPVTLRAQTEGQAVEIKAFTVDASRFGARVESNITFLSPGQSVEFISNEGHVEWSRVVWTRKAEAHHLGQVGIEFQRPLTLSF